MKSKMKKLVSLVLAMAMVFTMSAVVFADSTDSCTITIKGTTEDVTYTAYKLLDVTQSGTNYSYTVNSAYSDVLTAALTSVGASTTDVVAYLSDNSLSDSAVQNFADAVYKNLSKATSAVLGTDYYTVNGSDATTTLTVSYGYYLIVEASAGDGDSVSLVMLDTADNDGVEFTTKEAVPELTKKLKDINDSTDTEKTGWQDSADYDIGDSVPYQLTATLPDQLSRYTTYKLIFHDVMQKGLTFNNDVTVYADDTEVSSDCYTVLTDSKVFDADCTFEVVISDVKTLEDASGNPIDVDSDTMIYVYYTATLNSNAVIGNSGNWNTAYLEYSNNPYASGSGTDHETGKTPEETVVVLTYDVLVTKVDENGAELKGAEFTLEKYDAASQTWVSKTLVKNTAGTTFSFTGLDDGWYRITETTTPKGYNSIDPIYFIVTGTHKETSPDSTEPLTALTYEVAEWDEANNTATAVTGASQTFNVVRTKAATTDYLATTNIENKSGTLLPSTGGIGTTIFYIVGAVLVLGAGVILVTRRRTRA